MRQIVKYAVEYDSITFYNYLKIQVQEAQGLTFNSSAYWLLSDSANVLVEVAKERAETCEVNPKWKVLVNILEECIADRLTQNREASNILILVDSSNALVNLTSLLALGLSNYTSRLSKTLSMHDSVHKRQKNDISSGIVVQPSELGVSMQECFDTDAYFETLLARKIIIRRTDTLDEEALSIVNPFSIIIYSPNLQLMRTLEV